MVYYIIHAISSHPPELIAPWINNRLINFFMKMDIGAGRFKKEKYFI